MKKNILASLLFAALSTPNIHAAETEIAFEPALSTTLTVGYDSRYVLYGYRLTRHLYKADVYLYYPLSEKTSVWGGSWYGYLPDGTYNEVDVYGGIDHMLNDVLSVGFAYSLFNYIEVPYPSASQAHEFAVHTTYTKDQLTLSLRDQYDTEGEGNLIRGMATWNQAISDKLSLVAYSEVGYAAEYYIDGNLWNHALIKLSAPYTVNDTVSIGPYIARSIPLAAIDSFEQYETIYGISASVFF